MDPRREVILTRCPSVNLYRSPSEGEMSKLSVFRSGDAKLPETASGS